MKIRTIKYLVTAAFCIAISQGSYSADELYGSELSGLAYINIPFSGNKGYSSPTFSFTVMQTPTTNITSGIANEPSIFLNNPNRKALFDVQYDLAERQWSRFAFGGINSLVYDDVLYANGGGSGIDPRLVGLGIVGIVGIVISVNSNGDDDPPHECNDEGMTQIDPPALNLHEECESQPETSDMRLKRDIVELVTLENGIKLYSFRYLWEDTIYVGVMAQDLLEHEPYRDAVVMQQSGFYAVHYERLGLQMITLEEWHSSQLNIYSDHKIAANL